MYNKIWLNVFLLNCTRVRCFCDLSVNKKGKPNISVGLLIQYDAL